MAHAFKGLRWRAGRAPGADQRSFLEIHHRPSSRRLGKVLRRWNSENWRSHEHLQSSLLRQVTSSHCQSQGYSFASFQYQFAFPVRSIETQDRLFAYYELELLIEIRARPSAHGHGDSHAQGEVRDSGPSTNLTRAILCHAKNGKEMYYQFEDEARSRGRRRGVCLSRSHRCSSRCTGSRGPVCRGGCYP